MAQKLTARAIDSIKATPGKRAEYYDSVVTGLMLRVTPKGVKTWRVFYRHRGRNKRVTLGTVDAIGLAEARDRARTALEQVRDGLDPASEKRLAKQAQTIDDLITDFIEKYSKRRKRSWREDQRMLIANVLPVWKHRAIADIKRRDVRQLIEDIAVRAPVGANRVLAVVRKMLNFAVDQEIIETNPAARFARPTQETSRDRVLTGEEIRQAWADFEALSIEMAATFKLRLVTAQRGIEVRSMRWCDVDLQSGWWTIPATVAKNKLGHRVPLSPMALAILKGLGAEAGIASPDAYVLAGARGRRQQTEAAATFSVKNFRGHDLRRTAASIMTGSGVPRLVVSRILNHVEKGVTAVYDRHSYDAEKRAALDKWSAQLQGIINSVQAATEEAKVPSRDTLRQAELQ